MSPRRIAPWLLLFPVFGAAGWFGGQWAFEGLQPSARTPSRSTPQAAAAAAREPAVPPASPEGKWMARVKAAGPGDFAALFDELDSLFPPETSYETRIAAQTWLLSLWITRDPEAATAAVAAKKDPLVSRAFGTLLGSIAPDKVAALLDGPLRASLGDFFPAAVLRALADSHPDEFLKLNLRDPGDAYAEHYNLAIKNLADADPAAAAEAWLRRGMQAPRGKNALYTLLEVWTSRDPQMARRWVDALTDPETRRRAQHAWLGTLAKTDMAAARRELAAMDPGAWIPGYPERNESAFQYPQDARTVVLKALARTDFAAALGELENMNRLAGFSPPDIPVIILGGAIAFPAADSLPDNPAALLAAYHKQSENSSLMSDPNVEASIRLAILERKVLGWRGPPALQALQFLLSDSCAGKGCDQARILQESLLINQFIYRGIQPDPEAALQFISQLPEADRGRVARATLPAVSSERPDLIARTVAMIPPEQWNPGMGEQLGHSPQAYSTLMATLPETGPAGEAQAAFTKTWAREDPSAAAQWIVSLPSAAPAARGLTEGWAAYDEIAASTWAASLPPGRSLDGAALGIATAVAATAPDAAWQWAASIADATLSADAFTGVARQWGRNAPPEFRQAFSTALDRSGLTNENKTAALALLDNPGAGIPPSP